MQWSLDNAIHNTNRQMAVHVVHTYAVQLASAAPRLACRVQASSMWSANEGSDPFDTSSNMRAPASLPTIPYADDIVVPSPFLCLSRLPLACGAACRSRLFKPL